MTKKCYILDPGFGRFGRLNSNGQSSPKGNLVETPVEGYDTYVVEPHLAEVQTLNLICHPLQPTKFKWTICVCAN